MDVNAPSRRRGIPRSTLTGRARTAFGILLLVCWLAGSVLGWAAVPREIDLGRLQDDLGNGRVTSWALASTTNSDGPQLVFRGWTTFRPPPAGTDGQDRSGSLPPDSAAGPDGDVPSDLVLVYRVDTAVGAVRYVDLWGEAEAQRMVAQVRGSTATAEAPRTFSPSRWALTPSFLAFGLALAWVVFGPRPTRGTRWAWGIWTAGLVFGLGVVALAVLEVLRPRLRPYPQDRDRVRGIVAFCSTVVVGLPVALLLWALRSIAGDVLVPGF